MSIPRQNVAAIQASVALSKARIQAASGRLSTMLVGRSAKEIEAILALVFDRILVDDELELLRHLGIED